MAATGESSLELCFCDRHVCGSAADRVIEVATPGVSRGCGGLADRADGNEGIGSSEIIDDARVGAVALGDQVGLLVLFPPSPYFSCRLS